MLKVLKFKITTTNPFFKDVYLRAKYESQRNPMMMKQIINRVLSIDRMLVKDQPNPKT